MRKTGVLLTAMLAMMLSGCTNQAGTGNLIAASGQETAYQQVITVNSKESVNVVPDMAEIVMGVNVQADDAADCQEQATVAMNRLVETLKNAGVAEGSMQTSGYNLAVRNDWNNNGEIIGYEMSAELTVRDIALDQVGAILEASVATGANQVRSISYLSSQYDASYQEALKQAVEKAREKAQVLAEASGRTLGAVVSITEDANNQEVRYRSSMAVAPEAKMGAGAAMDMMPGEIGIEAGIRVEFAIQ